MKVRGKLGLQGENLFIELQVSTFHLTSFCCIKPLTLHTLCSVLLLLLNEVLPLASPATVTF